MNRPGTKENNAYFKHYFAPNDLMDLFSKKQYELLYFAETLRYPSKKEKLVQKRWVEKILDSYNISDPEERQDAINNQLDIARLDDLVAVFKKK